MTTLLNQDERLRQVAFPGSHSNFGWMERERSNPLILGPLAWMVQQLASTGVQFDRTRLAHTFAAFTQTKSSEYWYEGKVFSSYLQKYVLGDAPKKPWMMAHPKHQLSAVEIHCSARLRALAMESAHAGVPSYQLWKEEESSSWCWISHLAGEFRELDSDGLSSIDHSRCPLATSAMVAKVLYESPLGNLESQLLF